MKKLSELEKDFKYLKNCPITVNDKPDTGLHSLYSKPFQYIVWFISGNGCLFIHSLNSYLSDTSSTPGGVYSAERDPEVEGDRECWQWYRGSKGLAVSYSKCSGKASLVGQHLNSEI